MTDPTRPAGGTPSSGTSRPAPDTATQVDATKLATATSGSTTKLASPASADAASVVAEASHDMLAHRRPMSPEVARARTRVYHAHAALEADLDVLAEATHSALDIPAKIRRNPVKSVALAGGAGFLLLGGPRRVIRSATSRIFPKRRDPYDGLLPDEVERILRGSAAWDEPGVKEALEADFADYLRAKGRQAPPPSAATSFWRTYDALLGPLGTVGARILVERLFAAEHGRDAGKRK